jgi:hypothetical protein
VFDVACAVYGIISFTIVHTRTFEILMQDSPPLPEGGMDKGKNIAATSDDKALSEVEHLLMRKTFTRYVTM